MQEAGTTMRKIQFAIAIPQLYSDGEFDPDSFRAYFAQAEELGFDSAWTQEQMLGSGPRFGPVEAMTYAAACSRRMRLGCAVLVSTLYSPVHLAKSLSTLDQLSRGRIEIGVGTGGKDRPFAAFGADPERYVARFAEGLAVMKALWTETRVTFDGEFWKLNDAAMEPKPFQKPYPPIWFGGTGTSALRRAVRLGNGFFGSGSCPTPVFAAQVEVIRAALARSARSADDFPIAKRIYIAVDHSAQSARKRINSELERLHGHRSEAREAAAIVGSPADCVRELRKVAEAGAELILFTPLWDQAEQAERIAKEVIPSLTGIC
jgi:probable F420-dependent oxidoreductase